MVRLKVREVRVEAGVPGTAPTHQIVVVTAISAMVTLLGTVWRQQLAHGRIR